MSKENIIKVEDSYTACSIIEDFDGTNPSTQEQLLAWAYLIKTGQCWSLQGSYGRGAERLIETKVISKEGKILTAGQIMINSEKEIKEEGVKQ